MTNNLPIDIKEIYLQIKETLIESRKQAYTAVNSAIVHSILANRKNNC